MARVTYGGIITKIQGSIGGITFQDNTSGSVARLKPHPSNSSTTKQTAIHNIYQHLLANYNSLSPAKKALWSAYAAAHTRTDKYGNTVTLNGLNWFNCINYYYYFINSDIIDSPPAYVLPPGCDSYNLILSNSKIELDYGGLMEHPDTRLFIFASNPVREWSQYKRPAYRYITNVDGSSYNTIDITADWENKTELPWPPTNYCNRFYLSVFTFLLSSTSYINSPILQTTSGYNNVADGIGTAEIDWSLIVS